MLLLIKLTLTPLLVGGMSLAVRYWGPVAASILMGLPWMTGPVLFLIGLEKGEGWVASAAVGVELGTVALAAFTWGYTATARRFGWVVSLAAATASFAAVALAAQPLVPVLPAEAATALAAASLIGVYLMIAVPREARAPGPLPWWDIPARMLATAALVLVIAMTADFVGPTLSGIIATFPVIMTVIGTFTHAQWGGGATIVLFRAIMVSLLSFVMFFLVVAETVEALGLVPSYALAALSSVVTSTAILLWRKWLGRRVR
jgi:hypothetical protein